MTWRAGPSSWASSAKIGALWVGRVPCSGVRRSGAHRCALGVPGKDAVSFAPAVCKGDGARRAPLRGGPLGKNSGAGVAILPPRRRGGSPPPMPGAPP